MVDEGGVQKIHP